MRAARPTAAVVSCRIGIDGDLAQAKGAAIRAVDAGTVFIRQIPNHIATGHVQRAAVVDSATVVGRTVTCNGAAREV